MSKKSTDIGVGKKVLASALSAAMVVAFAPAVETIIGSDDAVAYAEDAQGVTTLTASDVQDGQITIVSNGSYRLGDNITADIVVASNISVDIDLGGFTLTNTGNDRATLSVRGMANVHGGSIVGGTSYYNIEVPKDSGGDLTLSDVTATAGNAGSSMIDNWGTMRIESGTYTDGLNVVKNEPGAHLAIGGGTLELIQAPNYKYVAVVLNYGVLDISNGIFKQKATSRWGFAQVIMNGMEGNVEPSTTVSGGSFSNSRLASTSKIFHHYTPAPASSIKVSAGTFNKEVSPSYLPNGYATAKVGSEYRIVRCVDVVSLDKDEVAMKVGDTLQLNATTSPDDVYSKDLTWSSDSSRVVSVGKTTGLITAKGVGTAKITATATVGKKSASCTVTVTDDAVKIGDSIYSTFGEALQAAQDGDTLTLLKDVKVPTDGAAINKDLTLDLNGKILTETKPIDVTSGKLTVCDSAAVDAPFIGDDREAVMYSSGKIVNSYSKNDSNAVVAKVQPGAFFELQSGTLESQKRYALSVNGEAIISDGYVTGPEGGVGVFGSSKLTIKGGVIVGTDNAAIAGNGSTGTDSYEVNVEGGSVIGHISSDGYIACGIYSPNAGTINISNGEVYADGGVGVLVRGGKLNVTGGTVVSTGNASGMVGDSTVISDCYGIYVDGTSNYPAAANKLDAEISGGVVKTGGAAALSLTKTTGGDSGADKGTIRVTGGKFSTDPTEYVADGYVVTGSGPYTVTKYVVPDPTPTPTPTPEPAAPGTNVSGTDASGNTVEATVTDNNKITLPDGTEAAGSVEYKGTTTGSGSTEPVSSAEIPSTVTANGSTYVVTKIADDAFNGQEQLKSVSIPETVIEIGDRAFAGTGISSVALPAATKVVGAGVFQGCDDLESIDIESSALTSIPDDAFRGCTSLTSILIPSTVETVGARAFKDTALKSVELPAATASLGIGAFQGCAGLKSAGISKAALTEIPAYAFSGTSITSIDIPGTVKSIGKRAFRRTKLKTVSTDAKVLARGAFSECTSLKAVSLPKAVEIDEYAFYGNAKLKTLTTGTGLKSIGPKALKGAGKFKVLTITSKKLTKKGVEDSLKGSAVTTVEVAVAGSKKIQDKYAAKYKKLFKKANSGKSVLVVKVKKAGKK